MQHHLTPSTTVTVPYSWESVQSDTIKDLRKYFSSPRDPVMTKLMVNTLFTPFEWFTYDLSLNCDLFSL